MNSLFLVVAIFIGLAFSESDVVSVTSKDQFDSLIDGSTFVLLEAFAPWCGHCKNLAPEYERVATAFKNFPSVVIANLDATEQTEIASDLGITGYPTLKWYSKGSSEPEAFDGPRTADGIVNWINQKTGLAAFIPKEKTDTLFLTPSNFDSIVMDTSKNVLVEFFAPWCGHCKALKPEYEIAAKAFLGDSNTVIAALDADAHGEIAKRFGVTGYPTVKFFPKSDKSGDIAFTGERNAQGIVTYINENTGTARNVDGTFQESYCRTSVLDEAANDFVINKSKRSSISETVSDLIDSESQDTSDFEKRCFKYYSRVMAKIEKKGNSYVAKEIARLTKLSSGTLAADKLDWVRARINVLGAFN